MTVEVAIESVTAERREISVSYPVGSEKRTIALDVSRKAEITLNEKPATIESLRAGQKATIEYDKKLEVVTKITATGTTAEQPRLLQVQEIEGTSPWLTDDGLTIYWELPGAKIATAHRERSDAYFTDKKELLPGRHPTVSGDELEIIVLARGNTGEPLHSARRETKDVAFSRAHEIAELASQPNPKNPCLSSDALTLVFNRATSGGSEMVLTTRPNRTSPWAAPKPLPVQNPPQSGFLTWPFLSADGLRLFCAHEGSAAKTAESRGKLMVWTRANNNEPFAKYEYLELQGVPPLVGRSPRFVASTGELFFASLTTPPGNIAILKNYAPAGKASPGWIFLQLGKAEPDSSYVVSSDGGLLCFQEAGYAIQSAKTFEQVNLSLEFRYTKGDRIFKNGGAIVIGAKTPDLTSTDWTKRIPLGFELKLAPGQAGDIILPTPTFQSELPLGQKREGRRVSRTQAKGSPAGQWNKLEVETDNQNGLTVKLNGDVVNKLAKAESVSGRIVIWPLGSEMQFRNAVAKSGDTEEKLAFDRIEKPK